MTVALLEVSHWHTPLYVDALRALGVEIVAVSDERPDVAVRVAGQVGCRAYADYSELLARERPDFVFAFGRHAAMPAIASALIQRRIPFAIEKPVAVSATDLEPLVAEAGQAGLFVAVPFVFRYAEVGRVLAQQAREGGPIGHAMFRFLAGPPERYLANSAWLLTKREAGGGCLTNLGAHFIDLFLHLVGKPVEVVSAVTSNHLWGYEVEDYGLIVMRAAQGSVGVVETGYTFPSLDPPKRFISYSLGQRDSMTVITHGALTGYGRDLDPTVSSLTTDTDDFYLPFVEDTLRRVQAGQPPLTGLREMLAVRRVLDVAYRLAARPL